MALNHSTSSLAPKGTSKGDTLFTTRVFEERIPWPPVLKCIHQVHSTVLTAQQNPFLCGLAFISLKRESCCEGFIVIVNSIGFRITMETKLGDTSMMGFLDQSSSGGSSPEYSGYPSIDCTGEWGLSGSLHVSVYFLMKGNVTSDSSHYLPAMKHCVLTLGAEIKPLFHLSAALVLYFDTATRKATNTQGLCFLVPELRMVSTKP